jgi:hypothetical protein
MLRRRTPRDDHAKGCFSPFRGVHAWRLSAFVACEHYFPQRKLPPLTGTGKH